MEFDILTFLIVCPLVGIAGFVDAVAGGGGLISLPAYLIAGFPVHNAIATNKLSSGMGTIVSTYKYAKRGYVPWKIAGFCIIAAFTGSALGANMALLINDRIFKIMMLFILPITAIYVGKSKALVSEKEPLSSSKTLAYSLAAAFIIGAYDGFYGPGTGTFLILLLTAVAHLSLSTANGVSKVINLTTNIASLAVYLYNGKVIACVGLVAGIFGIIGNYLGATYFDKGGAKVTKPIMIGVLTIFFIKVVYELFLR